MNSTLLYRLSAGGRDRGRTDEGLRTEGELVRAQRLAVDRAGVVQGLLVDRTRASDGDHRPGTTHARCSGS